MVLIRHVCQGYLVAEDEINLPFTEFRINYGGSGAVE